MSEKKLVLPSNRILSHPKSPPRNNLKNILSVPLNENMKPEEILPRRKKNEKSKLEGSVAKSILQYQYALPYREEVIIFSINFIILNNLKFF